MARNAKSRLSTARRTYTFPITPGVACGGSLLTSIAPRWISDNNVKLLGGVPYFQLSLSISRDLDIPRIIYDEGFAY